MNTGSFSVILTVISVFLLGAHSYTLPNPKAHAMISSLGDLVQLFPSDPADIKQRLAQSLQEAQSLITAIIAVPDDKRTFANTAAPLDRLASHLQAGGSAASNLAVTYHICEVLSMTSNDDALRAVAEEARVTVKEFLVESVENNQALYAAFKTYVTGNAQKETLTPEQRYYLAETMADFKRNGLDLPEETRREVMRVQKELAMLEQDFSSAINTDTSHITVKKEELAGLPEDFIANLKKNSDGLYILGVDYPTYLMVIQNCPVEETRKKLYLTFENRAYPANDQTFRSMITKRDELAKLLGYPSYAHFNLDGSMAGTPEKVDAFLEEVCQRAAVKQQQEFEVLTHTMPADVRLTPEGKMQPWSSAYVKNLYKKKHYNLDEQEIAQYFPMEKTVAGLLDIYRQFLSIEFKETPIQGLWDPSVTLIQVFDKQGTKLLGYLLLDLYPRANKYGHACECGVIPAVAYPDGSNPPAVAVVIANFPKSTATKPALLTRNDVETFFHEFGHAIHEVLGRTTLTSFAGTNTKRDFVEMPSQMLEEWMADREMLKKVSSHYKTGQPLPDTLLDAIVAAKHFDTGNWIVRQVFLSKLALAYFKEGAVKDPHAIYGQLYQQLHPSSAYEPAGHMYTSWGHLTDYAAQYYGYLWSKVYALDLFSEIKKHGLLNPVIGQKYVQEVIGKGGSIDPNQLLKNFLGRAPSSDAFFTDLGI